MNNKFVRKKQQKEKERVWIFLITILQSSGQQSEDSYSITHPIQSLTQYLDTHGGVYKSRGNDVLVRFDVWSYTQ